MTDKKWVLLSCRTQELLTNARTGLELLLSLAEGDAFPSLALAKVQAHSVIFSISWWRALTAIPWRQTPFTTQSRAQQLPHTALLRVSTTQRARPQGLLSQEGYLSLASNTCPHATGHPGKQRKHTCAVRHSFASSINSLLALLLGCLKLTIFTARTVPITREE